LKTEVNDVRWSPDDTLEIRVPKIRRLYVVGAGASCPYGLPTLKTLSRELCAFLKDDDRERLVGAIYEALGIDLSQSEVSPDFEELLNRLDTTALQYISTLGLSKQIGDRQKAFSIAINGLRELLLQKCHSLANQEGPYDRLVSSLTEDDAVVSFNWDVLLELAFKRNGKGFCYWDNSDGVTVLLKPHGSINWFALLDRELLVVDTGGNWAVFGNHLTYYLLFLRDPLGSRYLGKSMVDHALASVPAIVPPIASKTLAVGGLARDGFVSSGHERAMVRIWTIFGEFVRNATEMVVIGYSLPGTDGASIAILKNFVPDTTFHSTKKLMVVDRDPQVLKRYQRLVHPNAILVSPDFEKFDPGH